MALLKPHEFKAMLRNRGWSMANAAWRWQVSPAHLSRLVADQNRPVYWDDAANGLPTLGRVAALGIRRERLAAEAVVRARRDAAKAKAAKSTPPPGAGYAYHGYLTIGAIVGVIQDIGTVSRIGEEGVVAEVRDDGKGEIYRIVFERGELWFDALSFADFLIETGKERAMHTF